METAIVFEKIDMYLHYLSMHLYKELYYSALMTEEERKSSHPSLIESTILIHFDSTSRITK